MTAIREFRIHRFGGPEVLAPDEVEPSLPRSPATFLEPLSRGLVSFDIWKWRPKWRN